MYLVLTIFLLGLYLFLNGIKNKQKGKAIFIIVTTFILCLLSALKNFGVGPDTYQYYLGFNQAKITSWGAIFHDIKLYLSGNIYISDPGYDIIEKGFHYISDSFYVYSFFVALVLTSAIGKLMFMTVEKMIGYVIGYLYFITLLFLNMPNNLYRQTMALGILLWAFIIVIEKKNRLLPFILCAFAILVHRSAIIGIIPFAFIKWNKTNKIFISAIVLAPLFYIFGKEIVEFLVVNSDYDRYASYADFDSQTNPGMLIVEMLIFYVIGLFSFSKIRSLPILVRISFACYSIAIATVSFMLLDTNLVRISYYFSIWGMFYLPNCYESNNKILKNIFLCVIFTLLIGRAILVSPNYSFFWERMELRDRYLRK